MTLPATFAATLVDEWARSGVQEAVVCPGSRSSPFALALLDDDRLRLHVRLDERSAGFFAIGLALASRRPVVVVTTSGTAAAELHPALVEADLAGVPLVVVTADRPAELHGVGAPQVIDQDRLFGAVVRHHVEVPPPEEATAASWRPLASRLVAEARSGPRGPGPVHANVAFREPLGGTPDASPPGRTAGSPYHEVVAAKTAPPAAVGRLVAEATSARRGVVVAGRGAGDAGAVAAFAAAFSFPVLADSLAFERLERPGFVALVDPIVKSPEALGSLCPDLVVHIGAPPASRALAAWHQATAAAGATHVLCDPYGRFADPDRLSALVLAAHPSPLLGAAAGEGSSAGTSFRDAWTAAEEASQQAVDEVLAASGGASEPGTARALFSALADDALLVVASSMPVRDVDAFARPRPGAPRVLANRGANGIDGVVSTVLGAAAARTAPTYGLVGDLCFLHDLSAHVWAASEEPPEARIVVLDNAGGGIFSFLPYAAALDEARFERALATPQATDLAAVARALGCAVAEVDTEASLAEALPPGPGISVVVIRTDRRRNVAVHAALDDAVAKAVARAVGAA